MNQVLFRWFIDPYPGKGFLVKKMTLVKVPNLDYPVRAIANRFDLFSKLVSELNVCNFRNLLFHMDLTTFTTALSLSGNHERCFYDIGPFYCHKLSTEIFIILHEKI